MSIFEIACPKCHWLVDGAYNHCPMCGYYMKTCPTCGGLGGVTNTKQLHANGYTVSYSPCPDCQGEMKVRWKDA